MSKNKHKPELPNDSTPRTVRAYVILRGQRTESVSFVANPADSDLVKRAIQNLEDLGFTILSNSAHSISIEGEKPLFEKVFGSKVVVSKTSKKGLEGVSPRESITFKSEPQIPESLKEVAQAITFGSQTSLH